MSPRHLLLVEDTGDDEELALLALERIEVEADVLVARDGEEAVRHLEGLEPGGLPAVVLMDLHLPRVDGFEVLRWSRGTRHTRLLPVVVMTSSRAPEDVRRAYELGANGYVCIPVELGAFSEVVGIVGRYWLAANLSAEGDR